MTASDRMTKRHETFVAGPHHMETASGVYVDLLDPDPELIRLEDIAHHLAQINRYTGAARRPISVAEHALLVAERLRVQAWPPAVMLRGLHHDDAEAYGGDVGRPLKLALGTAYREIEARVDAAIQQALNLPTLGASEWEAVKAADDWALAAEARHLLPSAGRGWFCDGLYDPTDPTNPPATLLLRAHRQLWDVNATKQAWLDEHHALTAMNSAWEAGQL